ncbi:helix-turn-helix transcriptional regulator [Streptococcus suis]|uniref:helix-turn-helix transcriptional regulator n=1 Tax=Streptococcus suis TaxID=1307 RepID=UPI0004183A24|nr:helix-turn-helix transcriptional regulator [Streptococcus suis]HEM3182897.1 helix-turn-helix transcriptional regulator [Streptococcus suis 89-5259]
MANIITNLKEYRKAKKISQQELAQLVGVRRETIVHLENNRYNPSLEMVLKIAEIFDCHVEELFQLKKEAEND